MTRTFYDPVRRVVAVRDSTDRTMTMKWCSCGSLDALVDEKGQQIRWERDLQGRITREIRADGTTSTDYTFEATTSRLKTITDPKGQVATFAYNVDNSIQSLTFTNATIATPSVTYTYDTSYSRIASMVDGTGTTSYTYHPVGTLGALQVATVDGPLTNDTITSGYDEINRLTSRAINGSTTTWTYDALGRLTSEVNPLGTFTYGYDGITNRLTAILYPNGQTTTFAYLNDVGDHRLQTIHHQKAGGATLSKSDYTYNTMGNVITWQQQVDSGAPTLWRYNYDAANELLTAVQSTTGATPTVLKRYAYAYDVAGNRTTEQIDDSAWQATYDVLNRLLQQQPGGMLRFAGTVNEPASVTIQGRPATVDATNVFSGGAVVAPGTMTVPVQAIDPSGNTTNANFEVDALGTAKTFYVRRQREHHGGRYENVRMGCAQSARRDHGGHSAK